MQMFIVNITCIIHSLKFCGFNQLYLLVALKPQFGLQTCDQMNMDKENKEYWKWSDVIFEMLEFFRDLPTLKAGILGCFSSRLSKYDTLSPSSGSACNPRERLCT